MHPDDDVVETPPNGMDSVEETTNEGNPSWQELYDVLPQGYQALVEPTLSKWDKSTQAKFTANAEAQRAYEPYKQFLDNEIGSDQIQQALSVAQLIDSDPKAFMAQMQAYFGEEASQDPTVIKPPVENDDDDGFETKPYDLTADANFKKMQEQQDTIAGYLAQEVETKRAAKEDAFLATTIKNLTEKYGEFDEDYVYGSVINGVDMEDAVKKYHSLVETIRTKPAADANLPNILTPGGGLPSEQTNPADFTKQQRMAYAMAKLQEANKT